MTFLEIIKKPNESKYYSIFTNGKGQYLVNVNTGKVTPDHKIKITAKQAHILKGYKDSILPKFVLDHIIFLES